MQIHVSRLLGPGDILITRQMSQGAGISADEQHSSRGLSHDIEAQDQAPISKVLCVFSPTPDINDEMVLSLSSNPSSISVT